MKKAVRRQSVKMRNGDKNNGLTALGFMEAPRLRWRA